MATPLINPVNLQTILGTLPDIEQRQRRAKKLRRTEEAFKEYGKRDEKSGFRVPTQRGGLYETVAQYRPESALQAFIGALGGSALASAADVKESEIKDIQQREQIGALETMGQMRKRAPGTAAPEGEPTEAALRGYLGALGGTDIGKDIFEKAAHRSGQVIDKKTGRLFNIMSDGSTQDTGITPDPKRQILTPEGQPIQVVDVSGIEAGTGESVKFGGGPAAPPPVVAPPGAPTGDVPGIATDQLPPGMSPEQAGELLSVQKDIGQNIPAELIQEYLQTGRLEIPPEGFPNAPAQSVIPTVQPAGMPPPQGPAAAAPSTGREIYTPGAYDKEAAKIAAQNAAAAQTADAEALKAQAIAMAKGNVEVQLEARSRLPQVRSLSQKVTRDVGRVLSNPQALEALTGGSTAARLSAMPFGEDLVKAYIGGLKAGTPEADAYAAHQTLTSQAFLQSYEDVLKGGGPISNIEGLKGAQAALQNSLYQSKEVYTERLRDFLQEVKNVEDRIAGMAGAGGAAPAAAQSPARSALRSKYGL